jgi:pilus assembly protein Flp/PilA
MPKTVSALLTNESGVTMIEYGLLALLVATASLVVISSIGTDVKAMFTAVTGSF